MTRPSPTAWRVVWWFGFVSLAADMVYEGARSVYGPLLAALGASAVVVGLPVDDSVTIGVGDRRFFGRRDGFGGGRRGKRCERGKDRLEHEFLPSSAPYCGPA